jgi:hypothetical protein
MQIRSCHSWPRGRLLLWHHRSASLLDLLLLGLLLRWLHFHPRTACNIRMVSQVLGMHLGGGILMHQHWLRRHLMWMLLLLRGMRGVWRLMDLIHWRVM